MNKKQPVKLLVGTRKGFFVVEGDAARKRWRVHGPQFLGHVVHHVVNDPRAPKAWMMAIRTGHLGPTVYRSLDAGKSWKEASVPPAFPKAPEGQKGFSVDHVFWLTPGHASEPGVWYAGTSPHGLFRSEDQGETWKGVKGFNEHPQRLTWGGSEKDGTPDGPKLHSILIDPRDPQHMYLGLSGGGVFETIDQGANWRPLNKGCAADFMPVKDPEYGHDPHCVRMHPLDPDRLYQQNHCGVYRMDRPDGRWVRIGKALPKSVGDIGFPVVLHPRDRDTAWVFPMDGTEVWPRVSPGGRPAAFVTRNGGKSWKRQDHGLPAGQAWFTVKRQAMTVDGGDPVGVFFGTTAGEVWGSRNEGEGWSCLVRHLPEIYSVEAAS